MKEYSVAMGAAAFVLLAVGAASSTFVSSTELLGKLMMGTVVGLSSVIGSSVMVG
jgi:hypothetical protein